MATALPLERALEQADSALKRRLRWLQLARDEQLTPEGDWNVWLILAGRGWGKTETGAEDFAKFGQEHPRSRLAIVAPTFGDARDTCVEGKTGLLASLPQGAILDWNRSLGELILRNDTRYKLFSGDKPERLRGPQHHRVWFDEYAAFNYPVEAWDMAMFGLRLGKHPQAIVTTTPKGLKAIRDLAARSDAVVTVGSTFDNAPNLPESTILALRERYEGTRLGRQELYGEILDEVEGALWNTEMLQGCVVVKLPQRRRLDTAVNDWVYEDDLLRVVVGVDPASTSGVDADSTGIVVCGMSSDRRGYVLADRTIRSSPDGWGQRVIAATVEFGADCVVVETNQGGEMAQMVIQTAANAMGVPMPRVKRVHASQSKRLRAEPVAALYEQGKVSHLRGLSALEGEMASFTPDSGTSPDRLDAMVHAMTELMLGGERRLYFHPR